MVESDKFVCSGKHSHNRREEDDPSRCFYEETEEKEMHEDDEEGPSRLLSGAEEDIEDDFTVVSVRAPTASHPGIDLTSSASYFASTSATSPVHDELADLRKKVFSQIHVALMRCGGEAIRPVLCESYRRTTGGEDLDEDLVRAYGKNLSLGVIIESENYIRRVNDRDEVVYAVPEEMRRMRTSEDLKENGSPQRQAVPIIEISGVEVMEDDKELEMEKDEAMDVDEPDERIPHSENQGLMECVGGRQFLKPDEPYVAPPLYNEPHHENRARYLAQLFETLRRTGKIRVPWSETVAAHYAYFNSDLNALEKEAKLTDLSCLRAYIAEKIAIKTKEGNEPDNRVMRLRTNWRVGMTPRRDANDYCESSSDDDRSRSVDSRGRKKPKKPRTWQSPVFERKKPRTPSKSPVRPANSADDMFRPVFGPCPVPTRKERSPPEQSKRDRPLCGEEREDRPLWSRKEEHRKSRKDIKRRSRRTASYDSKSTASSRSSSRDTIGSVLTDWAPDDSAVRRRHSTRSSKSSRNRRKDKKRRDKSCRRTSRSSSRSSSSVRTRRSTKRHRRNSSSSREDVSRSPKRYRSRSSSRSRGPTRNTVTSTSNSTYPRSPSPPVRRNTLADKIAKLAAAKEIVDEMEKTVPGRPSRSVQRRGFQGTKSTSESGDDFTTKFAKMAAGGERQATTPALVAAANRRISINLKPDSTTSPKEEADSAQKRKKAIESRAAAGGDRKATTSATVHGPQNISINLEPLPDSTTNLQKRTEHDRKKTMESRSPAGGNRKATTTVPKRLSTNFKPLPDSTTSLNKKAEHERKNTMDSRAAAGYDRKATTTVPKRITNIPLPDSTKRPEKQPEQEKKKTLDSRAAAGYERKATTVLPKRFSSNFNPIPESSTSLEKKAENELRNRKMLKDQAAARKATTTVPKRISINFKPLSDSKTHENSKNIHEKLAERELKKTMESQAAASGDRKATSTASKRISSDFKPQPDSQNFLENLAEREWKKMMESLAASGGNRKATTVAPKRIMSSLRTLPDSTKHHEKQPEQEKKKTMDSRAAMCYDRKATTVLPKRFSSNFNPFPESSTSLEKKAEIDLRNRKMLEDQAAARKAIREKQADTDQKRKKIMEDIEAGRKAFTSTIITPKRISINLRPRSDSTTSSEKPTAQKEEKKKTRQQEEAKGSTSFSSVFGRKTK